MRACYAGSKIKSFALHLRTSTPCCELGTAVRTKKLCRHMCKSIAGAQHDSDLLNQEADAIVEHFQRVRLDDRNVSRIDAVNRPQRVVDLVYCTAQDTQQQNFLPTAQQLVQKCTLD